MVVVLGCHLGLLMLMLRPVSHQQSKPPLPENDPLVLKLRFIPHKPPAPSMPPIPRQSIARTVRVSRANPPIPQPAIAAPQSPPITTPDRQLPDDFARNQTDAGDGGFQARLRNAQRSGDIHGVPGSDTPSAPGIHMVDPMSQGIGAVMRSTQRLFGITNSHCIDADVWRHLTPEERKTRHVSLRDADKVDEKYGCNRPLGLSL
jgi:hypothetical protein